MAIGRVPGATGIQPSIVDAKGDIIAATAADSVSRLAVGANNTILTADSSVATGLKWAGDWTNFTPSFTNFTVGNATISNAMYLQVGKMVMVHCEVLLGSTSSVTGAIRLTLPVTAKNTESWLPTGILQKASGGGAWYSYGYVLNTTTMQFYVIDASTTDAKIRATSSTIPFTWASGDSLFIDFSYGVA